MAKKSNVRKCEKCGFKSENTLDFCGTYKILDGQDICRPCGGAPVNKDLEGNYLYYLALGVGKTIETNEPSPRGCM